MATMKNVQIRVREEDLVTLNSILDYEGMDVQGMFRMCMSRIMRAGNMDFILFAAKGGNENRATFSPPEPRPAQLATSAPAPPLVDTLAQRAKVAFAMRPEGIKPTIEMYRGDTTYLPPTDREWEAGTLVVTPKGFVVLDLVGMSATDIGDAVHKYVNENTPAARARREREALARVSAPAKEKEKKFDPYSTPMRVVTDFGEEFRPPTKEEFNKGDFFSDENGQYVINTTGRPLPN